MAFALKGAGGTVNSTTANQSTLVLTTATTAGSAGDLAVIRYAIDNNQTTDGDEGAVTGIVDSVGGNTWVKAVEFTNGNLAAQAGATCGIWYCNISNAIATGSTITLSLSNNTSRDATAAALEYFTLAGGQIAAVEGTPGTLAADAAAAGSLDVTTSNIACLRIRAIASESSTATALTKTAAFTAVLSQDLTTGGASATNMAVRGEYAVSTGTGLASNPTGGAGSVDHASVYVAFKEVANTMPQFAQYDWPRVQPVRFSQAFFDAAIWSLTTPFIPVDYQKTWRPYPSVSPTIMGANANLYPPAAAQGPFKQLDWGKTYQREPSIARDPNYNNLLYTAATQAPFYQLDWPKSYQREPSIARDFTYNQNLFTNPVPVLNLNWAKPFTPPAVPPPSIPYNLNLYTSGPVAAPFNQTDWSKPVRLVGLPGLSDASIFELVTPFLPLDWSKPFKMLPSTPRVEGANLPLLTAAVVTDPFRQLDWNFARGPRFFKPAQIDGALIDATQPAPSVDFSQQVKVRASAPFTPPRNPNLLANPAPFNQLDWAKPFFPEPAPQVYRSLISNFYAEPFKQLDWPKVYALRAATDAPQPLNLNLYGAVVVAAPFAQIDWPKVSSPRSAPGSVQSLNPNLFTNPVPFNQLDWSKPFYPKPAASVVAGNNPLLFTEVPFVNAVWTPAQTLRSVVGLAPAYNVNLYAAQVSAPFYQSNWPAVSRPRLLPPEQRAFNPNLYTNRVPFAQYDWPRAINVYPFRPNQAAPNTSLLATLNVTLSVTESADIVAFIVETQFGTWIPATKQGEIWTASTQERETWTPAIKQAETWTDE